LLRIRSPLKDVEDLFSYILCQTRSHIEIIAEILSLCMEGKVKTQIMYRATLSFKQLNDYLRLLLHANLLEKKIEGRTTLKTTEKERSLLKAYNKLKHLLKEKQN